MAFDPDEYLNETGTTSSTATAEFDPDAYLNETEEQEAPFDPDAYLAEVEAPAQPSPPVGTSFFEEVAAIPQALRQAVDQPTEAMAETATVLGMPALGETLRGAVEGAEGYVPAAQRFMQPQEGEFQIGGFAPQFLPRAIVEQAGQIAGAIATRAAGAAIGGLAGSVVGPKGTVAGAVAGSFLGPALFEMSQIVGPVARERAANQGREEPTTDDLAWAWSTAGASGALNAIGAKYLPNGDKLVGGLAQRISTSIAGEGATEGLQSVVQQAGQTFLTEQGLDIKPKEAFGEAIMGGGAGGVTTLAAAPFTPTPEVKATVAADTKVAAEQAAPVAPETAQIVSEQANQVIAQAQAEEAAETPEQRVARLQREAQEAAGIELEEEAPVSGLPPVEPTPPVTPTPEAAVAPVEPVVAAEGAVEPAVTEVAPVAVPEEQKFNNLRESIGATNRLVGDMFQDKIVYSTSTQEGQPEAELVVQENEEIPNRVTLETIFTPPEFRGRGLANQKMQSFLQNVDRLGMDVQLSVDPESASRGVEGERMTREQLKDWYRKYGFFFPEDSDNGFRASEATKNRLRANTITYDPAIHKIPKDENFYSDRDTLFNVFRENPERFQEGGIYAVNNDSVYVLKDNKLVGIRDVVFQYDYETKQNIIKPQATIISPEAKFETAAPEAAPAAVEPTPVAPPPVTPQLEPLRRVARAEQTEEDVAGLVDAGFAEIYNGQPVLTQAGIEALPEAERPRLTPEVRKIQIDTRTSEAAAEAISKNLRIGVDQVPVDVRMPAGWTLVGDVYVPPQPQAALVAEEEPVTPPTTKTKYTDEAVANLSLTERGRPSSRAIQVLEVIAKGNTPYAQLAQTILDAAKTNPEINFAIDITRFTRTTPDRDRGRLKGRSFYETMDRTIRMHPNQASDVRITLHEIIHAILVYKLPKEISSDNLRGKRYKKALDKAIADKTLPKPLRDIIRGYVLAAEKMGAAETLWGEGPLRGSRGRTINKSEIYKGVIGRVPNPTKAQREGGRMFEVEGMTNVKRVLKYLKENSITEVDVKRQDANRYDVVVAQSDLEKITIPKEEAGLHPSKRKLRGKGFDPSNGSLSWVTMEKKSPVANDPDAVVEYGFEYGLGNIDEFLSEALSNPEFQKALNEIEMESGKTVWQTIIDAIARILGMEVKAGSVLDVISRSAFELATEGDLLLAGGRTPTPAPTPEVREARIERDPEVQKAAQDLKAGIIDRDEYQRIVDMRMPLRKFEAVPIPATNDDMLRGLGERIIKRKDAAGNEVTIKKQDLIQAPESIAEGTVLESRLDIPAYENADVWVVSLHEPRPNINKGNAGPVVAYTPTSVLRNVEFGVTEQAAVNIAAGKQKTTIATMKGEFVPMTAEQAYELANTNKEQWVEIGMNPVRHSYFYDKDTQTPVVSAEEVVQVGGMVLAKNPVFGKREDYLYARRIQMGRAGMETSAVEARLKELGFPTGGIIRVVNEPDADFEGRTIILDGKVTGIELNASALKDNAAIDRVLNHEFAESANADGALNKLVERLTPKEKKEINDTITRLRYEERARTAEEAARAIETLAEAWKGRGFFTRAVARVEAWANKLGLKLTRRAAEYIAARNLADINSGFRTAYNRFINVKGEAREGKIETTENNKILIGNFYQDQIKSETKSISPTGANPFNHGTLGMSGGLRWRFRIKSGTLAVSDSTDIEGIQKIKNHIERRGFSINSTKSLEEAFEETHKGDAPPVDSVFSPEAFRRVGEGFKSRSKIIRMSIDDFLKLATQLPREQSQEAQNAFDAGIKWDSIPNFETRTDENGIAKIIGHEGRHRALVLKRAGYTEMPVAIIDRAIRWAEQTDPQSYDYVENFPTQLEAERTKERIPFPFSREDGTVKYIPQTAVIRESRREPEAIPTFIEGTPEAATLKEMATSMAKVDAASEAKGGKPETYKISEIASVWMDSGLGERELQDAIVEYTNLTPANAARVAKAIARQYDIQQSIATAFLETQTGLSVEAMPEGVALPKEVDPDRPKPVMQRLFEVFMGVRVPPTKITVNEKTALKQQIRLKAAANRAAKAAQKETSDQVIEVIKAMDLRGGVRPKQVQALAKRAAKVIWTNEKSLETFADYAAKVVENANYDADLREAKAAQARAKQLSKQKKIAMGPQREMLDNISKIAVNRLDDPRMYADVVNYYLRGFKAVLSPDYVVVPDSEMTSYLSQMQGEANRNQRDLDRAVNERLAEKYGVDIDDLNSVLEAADIISQLEANENREAMDNLLTEKAIETRDGLKAYDQTPLRADQRKLVDAIMKVDPKALDAEERQRFIRITNNIIYNNQTNGAEYFASVAKGQQSARAAAQDSDMIAKNKAWINLLPRLVSERMQRGWALELQSVADTFRNAFGKGAMAKVYKAMGMLDLNMGFTKANNTIDEIQEKIAEFHTNLEKKYKAAARNQDGLLAEGVAGFLIQKVPNKGETESIAQRRDLIRQDIANRRRSGEVDRMAMADRIETILNQIDGEGVQAVLNKLKQAYPANHESLVWYKDTLLPQYKDFLKNFDENFNDQANNYDNPNYLPIAFSKASPSLAITKEEEQVFYDQVSLRPKQAANTIKRLDYVEIPRDRTTGAPKEIEFNLRRNAFDSLSDQINKAYTSAAWQQLASFMKTPESEIVFGGKANKDFFIERLNRLRLSRMRRGAMSRGNIERAVDALSVISRKLGTGIALGGVYQWIKQPPDQIVTAIGSGGRTDLLAKNLAPSTQKTARTLLNKFSIGRRGDASAGYKYINQMEGHQNRLERYFSESKWDQVKEQGSKIADVWMIALKSSDFLAASAAWMTYYEGELNKRDIKIEDWAKEAELVDTDPARQEAAAFAEQMTDIYQGSSDPTQMATFAQSGKSGWENFIKAIFVPFNSFAVQQRMRLYSDARDVLNGEKAGVGGLAGTIGGLLLFHATKRLVLPVISGSVAGILYTLLGVDMEEPDEEKQKEEANKRWRQMQGEMLGNLLVGGTPQIVEAKFIDAMNYASYLISLQLESENILNDEGEVMSFDQYAKERSPFWRYRSFDNAMSLGMLDIGLGQAEQAILQTKMVADPEEMEMYTPEEQRLLYFSTLSEWLYLMRLNDADFARIVSKARRDMMSAAKEREKELKRIREGR